MSSIKRPPVHKIVILQLILVVMVALAGLVLVDQVAARSAFLGGLACALPNAYFIWRAFRFQGALQAHQAAKALYQGEAWKFLLTAVMFVVIFKLGSELNYLALFSGFITVQLGQMVSGKVLNL